MRQGFPLQSLQGGIIAEVAAKMVVKWLVGDVFQI